MILPLLISCFLLVENGVGIKAAVGVYAWRIKLEDASVGWKMLCRMLVAD